MANARSRLSRWHVAALAVPLLAIVWLARSGGNAAVDLHTEADLIAAGIEVPAESTEGLFRQLAPADPSALGEGTEAESGVAVPPVLAQTHDPTVAGVSSTDGPDDGNAADQSGAPSSAIAQPADNELEDQESSSTSLWCEIEVRGQDGVIRWSDDHRTAVLRRNDAWFHTPEETALAVLIPEVVDTRDEYVLRVWGGGTEDVPCTFVAGATTTAAPPTTPSTTTVTPTFTSTTTSAAPTTTTTTVPEAVAFVQLPEPISMPGGPVQMGFTVDLWGDDRTKYWDELEAVPGNGRLIAHEFKSFSKEINAPLYQWHIDQGRDLLLTWNGTTASTILDGTHDEWIREHARALKGLSGTVKLRFWHEPDVSFKVSWIEGDPQNFIDSWMYVRRIFVEEGAVDNIEWVWCPTAWNWNEQGARFYPGDANVDWICADGYSGMNLDKPLSTVTSEFVDFQAWADQRPSKPILIAEFGATEREAGDRAAWVEGIPAWVNASPNIRAVVYFDYDRRSQEPWDWRLRTEADAWQAMKDVLSSSPFGE